jgi:fucose 4-O-acetylase-like acetyltransferase
MKERVLYYDVAKALAIFFVIIGDVYIVHDPRGLLAPVSTFVHTFHTALFMFISGVFFKKALEKEWKAVFTGKVRQLVIPYLAWSAVLLFLVIIPAHGLDNILTTIEDYIKGGFLRNYWYLKSLFLFIIVTYVLVKVFRNDNIGCIASFVLFTFAPSVFNTALFIPYFVAGYFYGKYIEKINHWGWSLLLVIIAVALYWAWMPVYNYNIGESMDFKPYIIRTSIGIVDSILILTALRILCKSGGVFIPLSAIGKYTLGMYCCNCMFYEGWGKIFLDSINVPNSVKCILVSVITFILSFLLCKLFDRNKYTSLLFLGNKLR